MAYIDVEYVDNIAVLTLNNGATNAINPGLLEEFSQALLEVKRQAKGMLLCGGAKIFSMGFELPALIDLPRAEMRAFLDNFNELTLALYILPLPVICVMAGHTVAGGSIFALACDYRLASVESKKVGLNEIRLGVPVPYLADLLLKQIVGERQALSLLYSGAFLSFPEALEIGLIDETHAPDKLKEQALQKVAGLAAYNQAAFAEIKRNRTEEIREKYLKNGAARSEIFLDCWFSASTRQFLEDAARKF
ncbi:MAG: enoyl-CoA hydratase/isomerase family protein [Deltaproteobacteria bacterium]|nr:enoyl-CoA hydratase/isomerase family protein [Deltaproteobacteria bacterium]